MLKRVVIRCPFCGQTMFHKVSPEMQFQRTKEEGGLIPILINNFVCEHKFVAYIDKYFMIRGYLPVNDEGDLSYIFKLEKRCQKEQKVFNLEGECILVC